MGVVTLQVSSGWELWGLAQQAHLKGKLVSGGANGYQAETQSQRGQASQEKRLT